MDVAVRPLTQRRRTASEVEGSKQEALRDGGGRADVELGGVEYRIGGIPLKRN